MNKTTLKYNFEKSNPVTFIQKNKTSTTYTK